MLDLFFPPSCVHSWQKGSYLHKSYQRQLVPHPDICPVCKKHSPHFFSHVLCRSSTTLHWCIIGFSYNDIIKKLIKNFKYYHQYDVADYLAQRLYFHIASHPFWARTIRNHPEKTIVTSVPSHWRRKHITKWYNQSEILARSVAKKLWLHYHTIAKKRKRTRSQVSLKKHERVDNVRNSFSLVKNHQNIFSSKKYVIIVDDIVTTGSTLNEMSNTITTHYDNIFIRWAALARNTR